MSKYNTIFKNETITLSKVIDKEEYWLYDYTRGMNLSMRAKTEQDAFVEALMYYQKRLVLVENNFKVLKSKVEKFLEQVIEED